MKISLCIIARNESENIARCINSAKAVVDEIIVGDTGSEDDTVAIAESLGARVYHFKWVDDFAKARNFVLSKATGDWILFLDADEYISEDTVQNLRPVIQQYHGTNVDAILSYLMNIEKQNSKVMDSHKTIRIFRKHPDLAYVGAVHEYIAPRQNRKLQYADASEQIKVIHTGYSQEDKAKKKKGERNLQLLFKELQKKPNDGMLLYYIAESHALEKQYNEALRYAQKAAISKNLPDVIRSKNLKNSVWYKLKLNYPAQEIIEDTRRIIQQYPDYSDMHLFLGNLYLDQGRVYDTIECYEQTLKHAAQAPKYQSSVLTYIVPLYRKLAKLYEHSGQLHKSVEYYVELLKFDRHDQNSLAELLKILVRNEPTPAIMGFLGKLYQFQDMKDLVVLLQSSLKTKDKDLTAAVFGCFNDAQRQRLAKEHAFILLYHGYYENGAALLYQIHAAMADEESALFAAISADLAGRRDILQALAERCAPALGRVIHQLYLDEPAAEEMTDEEVKQLERLLSEYAFLGRIDQLEAYLHLLPVNRWGAIADRCYQQGEYAAAGRIYRDYLMNVPEIPADRLTTARRQYAEALYRAKNFGPLIQAVQDFLQADPDYFRYYELGIEAARQMEEPFLLRRMADLAKARFPDSSYIRSI